MDITESPIWLDIKKILENTDEKYMFYYTATIHIVKSDNSTFDNIDNGDIFTLKVISFDLIRDYISAFADQMLISVYLGLGDYVKRIYPNRRNIELTLYETDASKSESDSDRIKKERYKAVLIQQENKVAAGNEYDQIDRNTLNIKEISEIKFQLVNRYVEPLSAKTVSGTWKDTKPIDLLTSILAYESKRVKIDSKPALDALDIIEADNKQVTKVIIVPSHTPIMNLPTMTQELYGGVYQKGIGTYMQMYKDKKTWFIYPLYNAVKEKYNKAKQKLVIYQIPRHKVEHPRHTYLIENNVVYILCYSDREYKDNRQYSQYGNEAGFRIAHAKAFMTKPAKPTTDGPVGAREKLNTEIANEVMPDQMTTARPIEQRISANNFKHISRSMLTYGGKLTLQWDMSDPSILFPGMLCQYNYLENDTVKQLYGTLLYSQSIVQLDGKTLTSIRHIRTSSLIVHVEIANNLLQGEVEGSS